MDLSFLGETLPIVRFFIATSYSFKEYLARERDNILSPLLLPLFAMTMPKYVWIVEIGSQDSFKNGTCFMRFVLDATANNYDEMPYFLLHDRNRIFVNDRESLESYVWELDGTPFELPVYSHNLSEF